MERDFRGEFRQRVLVAGIITGVLSRVTDAASSQPLLAASPKEYRAETDFRRVAPAAAGRHDERRDTVRGIKAGPLRGTRPTWVLVRPVQAHRIVYEQPPLGVSSARDVRDEIDQQPVVRHMVLEVRMRPVGAP